MQKKLFITACFFAVSFIFFAEFHAGAVGIGGYISGANGGYDWTYDDDATGDKFEDSSTIPKFGIGFVLDTAVATDKLFNYRLNLGYNYSKVDNEKLVDAYGYDFHVYNSFGFALVRNESLRFWIGPQVGIGLLYGEYDVEYSDETYEFVTYFASLGAVAGINIHVNNVLSICFDGGARISKHTGFSDYGSEGSYMTGSGTEAFANISFIFRINERYSATDNI